MYEGRPQIVASVGYSESGVKKPCDFCLFSGAEPPEVSMLNDIFPKLMGRRTLCDHLAMHLSCQSQVYDIDEGRV